MTHGAGGARCDLHVHSRFSTDSGNFALRRARLGESFTEPERVYRVARARGMDFVTISDHNTVEGALRIAHLENTFLSVEVTTCFPEDSTPSACPRVEPDRGGPHRPSGLPRLGLRARRLSPRARSRARARAPAVPDGAAADARARRADDAALLDLGGAERGPAGGLEPRRLPDRGRGDERYLAKLAGRHDLEPVHTGPIALTGGSDDHGAIDIAGTWTAAPGDTPAAFLEAVAAGAGTPEGAHGSAVKLAHAMAALAANAYRESAESVPPLLDGQLRALFDDDADDAAERHAEIQASSRALVRLLGSRAREGGLGDLGFSSVGPRLASLAFAGGLELPYIFSTHHHRGARADVRAIEKAFLGIREEPHQPRAVVFTDTFTETNGVAGTMRRLAAAGARGRLSVTVAAAGSDLVDDAPGITALPTDWSMPLPAYEQIELRFPLVTDVLARLEADAPDLVHVATPGPIGITGLMAAKLLGIPVVGSYHTELGPYALQLTCDPVVAEVTGRYVDWFYRQCDLVLAPTHGVMTALAARGIGKRILVWGRGVDTADFGPVHRDEDLRSSLLDGATPCSFPSAASPTRSGSTSCSRRSGCCGRPLRARAFSSSATARRAPASRRELPRASRSSASSAAPRSPGSTPAPMSSASRAPPTPSARSSSRPEPPACRPSRSRRAAPRTRRPRQTGLLVPPTTRAPSRGARPPRRRPALRRSLGEGALAVAGRRTWERSFAELRDAYRIAVHGTPSELRTRIAA